VCSIALDSTAHSVVTASQCDRACFSQPSEGVLFECIC
jgi:hypothetical protein